MLANGILGVCGSVAHGCTEALSYVRQINSEYDVLFAHGVRQYGPTLMRVDQLLTGGTLFAGATCLGLAARNFWKGKNVGRGFGLLATGFAAVGFGIYNAYNTYSGLDTSSRKMDIIRKGQCYGNSVQAWRDPDAYCNHRGQCAISAPFSFQAATLPGEYSKLSALQMCLDDVPPSFDNAHISSR